MGGGVLGTILGTGRGQNRDSNVGRSGKHFIAKVGSKGTKEEKD